MRLTADLIQSSLSYINPIKERELDLRGHQIPAIENLGVASRDHDCIDFTDNDIAQLGNFPLTPRVRSLLLARNRVASIQPNLPKSIPNLESIVLTQNRISELADLDVLSQFARLTHVVLLDNPVTSKENYRHWMIWRCPSVRFLDFQKVKDAERTQAAKLFGTASEPTALAEKIMGIKSRVFEAGTATYGTNGVGGGDKGIRVKLTAEERKRVEQLIRNAKSLQEIAQLEKALNEGKVPGGVLG